MPEHGLCMPELNYIDRSFTKDRCMDYDLSIQTDRSGLTYCIRHSRQGEYIVFRKYRFDHVYLVSDLVREVIAVLDRDDILKQHFRSVHFMNYTQQSTLVPERFFNPENLPEYIEFNTGGILEGELFSNHIRPLDTYNVFVQPRPLVSLVTLHFKKVEFSSQATPFLWNLSHVEGSMDNSLVHVGLNTDFFDIAVVGDCKLQLYNTFQFVNETDLLYYVLYVCRQLSLSPQDIPVRLSGELSSRIVYFETLKQYLPRVSYEDTPGMRHLAPGLMQLITYKYLNLFNLQSCELSAESIKEE